MASLLKNVSNSILHAFNALQQEKPGFVNKSKLKVRSQIRHKYLDTLTIQSNHESLLLLYFVA